MAISPSPLLPSVERATISWCDARAAPADRHRPSGAKPAQPPTARHLQRPAATLTTTSRSSRAQLTPSIMEEEDESYLASLQLLSHHGISMAVKAVVELDIFNILALAGPDAQLSAAEIAAQIPNCDPSKAASRLDRVLRFLASHAILRCSASNTAIGEFERRYSLEPVYKHLAKNQDGVSLASAFLVTCDKASLASWQYLKDAVLDDINPFEKANGFTAFEYMAKTDHKFGEHFNNYMASVTKLTSDKIAHNYKGFEDISLLVDAGGGTGGLLRIIISKYPHIKGINFDTPHVISSAPEIPGVVHVAGDFLLSIPNGDAILLKQILHDWSDEDCIKILRNCYHSLPHNGKVIVIEQILSEIPEKNLAVQATYFVDLCMMVTVRRAKERSEKEFRTLANEAGFTTFKIASYAMNYHVIEFMK